MLRIDSRKPSTESQGFDGIFLPDREEIFPFDQELVGDVTRRVFQGLAKRKLDARVAAICKLSDRSVREMLAGRTPIHGMLLAAIVVALTRRPPQ